MAKKREEQPYSIKGAGKFLDVSRTTLYRLMKGHKVRTFKIGRKTYIEDAEMQRLLRELKKGV